MRTLLIAGTAVAALLGADAAAANERVVQRGPGMSHGSWNAPHPMQPGPMQPHPMQPGPMQPHPMMPQGGQHGGARWGSKVGGHWWGGVNAPGGWSAYRRPVRGWALPVYWNTPRFYISDWSTYGLQQPQYGYRWVRYYDDAVLIDGHGSVYDSVADVDWDGDGRYADDDRRDDDRAYAGGDDRYGPPPAAHRDDRDYDERRDNGVGGALAGAAAGGVAGALIGGRHDRVGGALIGAGVGAVAGYAIDKAEDRGRGDPPPHGGHGGGYPPPGPGPSYPPPPPRPYPAPPGHWTSPDGTTVVVTSHGGYGGSVTTVTVQTAPVITTTTTEIYEDNVTWSRPTSHKRWKPHRKVVCICRIRR